MWQATVLWIWGTDSCLLCAACFTAACRELQVLWADLRGDLTDPRKARHNLTTVAATRPAQYGPWWQYSCYGIEDVRC